jgi:hypothetical protein
MITASIKKKWLPFCRLKSSLFISNEGAKQRLTGISFGHAKTCIIRECIVIHQKTMIQYSSMQDTLKWVGFPPTLITKWHRIMSIMAALTVYSQEPLVWAQHLVWSHIFKCSRKHTLCYKCQYLGNYTLILRIYLHCAKVKLICTMSTIIEMKSCR